MSVKNEGAVAAGEKLQAYAAFTDSRTTTPNFQLCALQPVFLQSGQEQKVELTVDAFWIKAVLADGSRVDPDGDITLYVGTHQPDERSNALAGSTCLCCVL